MDHDIERYLNDHLAGSSGALVMIRHLIDTMENPQAVGFFKELKSDVEADRELLEYLLDASGNKPSLLMNAAGRVAAKVGFLKLTWEGFDPGELGLFEALEMLALGVQGKRLLWVTIKEIQRSYPEWAEVDFSELEREAIRQRNGVEIWRQEAARATFISRERQTSTTSKSK